VKLSSIEYNTLS